MPRIVMRAPFTSREAACWLLLAAVMAAASITAMQILLGLAVVAWLAGLAGRRRGLLRPDVELTLWLAALAGWSLLSALAAPEGLRARDATLSSLMWLAAPLATAVLDRERRSVVRAVLLLLGGLLGGWAVLEGLLWWDGDPLLRVRGPYSHHMTLAGVLMLVALQALPRPDLSPLLGGRTGRAGAWAALALVVAGVAATATRSALLALAVGGAVLLVLPPAGRQRAGRRRLAVAVAACALVAASAGLIGIALGPGLPGLRRSPEQAGAAAASLEDRRALWRAGAAMISQRPLLGVGANHTRRVADRYLDPGHRRPGPPSHLHSAWLTLAAERGLPALALLLALYARSFVRGRRLLPEPAAAGALAALAGFLVMGCFEDNFDDSEVLFVHLIILAGLWRRGAGTS
jgi:O-antigen ligase